MVMRAICTERLAKRSMHGIPKVVGDTLAATLLVVNNRSWNACTLELFKGDHEVEELPNFRKEESLHNRRNDLLVKTGV